MSDKGLYNVNAWCRCNYVSDRHSLIVLSASSAPEAIMFSVGWQAVHRTTSERRKVSHQFQWLLSGNTIEYVHVYQATMVWGHENSVCTWRGY